MTNSILGPAGAGWKGEIFLDQNKFKMSRDGRVFIDSIEVNRVLSVDIKNICSSKAAVITVTFTAQDIEVEYGGFKRNSE